MTPLQAIRYEACLQRRGSQEQGKLRHPGKKNSQKPGKQAGKAISPEETAAGRINRSNKAERSLREFSEQLR